MIPTRCTDPILMRCQNCKYGLVQYPDWVETREDIDGCCYDVSCVYGLEDTRPTAEEWAEFNKWWEAQYETNN